MTSGATAGLRGLTTNQRALFWAQVWESIGAFGLVSAFTLWAASVASTSADAARLVSWVVAANTVPRMVLAPVVTMVCRQWDETRVLQAANLLRGLICLAALPLLPRHGPASTVVVVSLVLLLGCLDQFFAPARAAAAQRNLREQERVQYGALNHLALSGIGLVSAAVTPPLFAAGGLRLWLAIGATCSLCSMAVLGTGYRAERDLLPRSSERGGHRERTREVARHAFTASHGVARVSWSIVAWGFALGLTNQTMAPLALRGLHVPLARYGWITGAFAAGGLGAYVWTRRPSNARGMASNLTAGSMLLAGGYLTYGLAPGLWCCVTAMLVAGTGFGLWSSAQGALLQQLLPNRRMAGYVAITSTLAMAATLAGSQLARLAVRAVPAHLPMLGYRASYVLAALAVLAAGSLRRSAAASTP